MAFRCARSSRHLVQLLDFSFPCRLVGRKVSDAVLQVLDPSVDRQESAKDLEKLWRRRVAEGSGRNSARADSCVKTRRGAMFPLLDAPLERSRGALPGHCCLSVRGAIECRGHTADEALHLEN